MSPNVFRGVCAITDRRQSCATASQGAWRLSNRESASYTAAVAGCLERCNACGRCRWISVSPRFADCSWYFTCSPAALLTTAGGTSLVGGYGGFITLPANVSSSWARDIARAASALSTLDTCPAEATGRRATLQHGLLARQAAEKRLDGAKSSLPWASMPIPGERRRGASICAGSTLQQPLTLAGWCTASCWAQPTCTQVYGRPYGASTPILPTSCFSTGRGTATGSTLRRRC